MAQYKVGDYVVHLAHGIGQIAKLDHKEMFGKEARLYYEVAIPKGTLWIPFGSEAELVLRLLTPQSDLAHYEQVLKRAPEPLNTNHRLRQLELAERLKRGSFQIVCEIVRDLTAHSWRKPLNESDSTVLRRAYDSLCREWAVASGLTIPEVNQYVNALLAKSKQAYHVKA